MPGGGARAPAAAGPHPSARPRRSLHGPIARSTSSPWPPASRCWCCSRWSACSWCVQSSHGDQRVRPVAVPHPHRVAHRRAARRGSACSVCSPARSSWRSPPSRSPCRSACSPRWPSPSTPAPGPASGSPAWSTCSPRCPSLLFGIWGFLFLSDKIIPISKWLADHLSFIPFFKTDEDARFIGSIFIAGIVVALMVLPIITAIVREVFSQTPPGEKEAALALGRHAVGDDPHRRAPLRPGRHHRRLDARPRSGARRDDRRRAAAAPGARGVDQDPAERRRHRVRASSPTGPAPTPSRSRRLMAAGLVLFLITLATNMIASVVVSARAARASGSSCDRRPITTAPTTTTADLAAPTSTCATGRPGRRRAARGTPSRPRRPIETTPEDRWTLLGSAVSALCLNWLILYRFTDRGRAWFGFAALLLRHVPRALRRRHHRPPRPARRHRSGHDRRRAVGGDRRVRAARAADRLHPQRGPQGAAVRLLRQRPDRRRPRPRRPPSGGGAHAIIGTIEQVGLALVWSLPLGAGRRGVPERVAQQVASPGAHLRRRHERPAVDHRRPVHLRRADPATSARAAGCSASTASWPAWPSPSRCCPTITRTVEVVLRLVPDGLREASLALGRVPGPHGLVGRVPDGQERHDAPPSCSASPGPSARPLRCCSPRSATTS